MPNEAQLSEVLSEFARTMVTDFPIQGILDRLVQRIVEVLPITAAGVTLISPGTDPRFVAASDASALRFEELQAELGEGPCIVAYQSGEAVAVADLRSDSRFPRFGPRAVEAGLVAVFTFPLRDGDRQLGALDLYRDTPGPLDPSAMDAAQTLADVAASYLLNAQARNDLRASSDRSRQDALHDPLTGLPNRVLFLERLDHAVMRGQRSGKVAAVLFVDLDRFKLVNDLYGHGTGDHLLVAVAHRLTAVLRPGDTLARMAGDEFVILSEDLGDPDEAHAIAARVVSAIAEPFRLSGIIVRISASVGIGYSGRGDQLSEDIVRDADVAMYQAKRKGGARHQIVDLRERDLAQQRATLEHDLQISLADGQLHMDYQPIFAAGNGRMVGAEALLRWDHPGRGPVGPTVFIPLAEQSGLISEIGIWLLKQACSDRRAWQDGSARLGPPAPDRTMSVNVSARQLMSPDFASGVDAVLSRTHTPANLITLEMTESVFIQDSERAETVLGDLKQLGVQLALDDFGTGYSSLNYLKRFPIDLVKIDQVFVGDLETDRASLAIVVAVIELAHTLGMRVVAEGVETGEQHEHLASLGCDFCQGFFFAHPMSAEALCAFSPAPDAGPRSRPEERSEIDQAALG